MGELVEEHALRYTVVHIVGQIGTLAIFERITFCSQAVPVELHL